MSVRIGSGLSLHPEPRVAAIEAATSARQGLGDEPVDLAVVFAAGAHLAAPEATLEGVHEALLPRAVIGCGAGGVLAGEKEVEDGTAVSVWAAALDGEVETFHATAGEVAVGEIAIEGLPAADGASALILLPDPYTFPTDQALAEINAEAPGVPVLGGLSSARTPEGTGALMHGAEVLGAGAVGARVEGIEILPCVSQGAAPVGPELAITAADGHVIQELAGVPALEKLRAVIGDLDPREQALAGQGLLLGIVIEGGTASPDYGPGDFLVRGLLGADPRGGAIAVGAPVEPGQIVRLHVRDAESADRDLREALRLRREALGGNPPAGALVFTCNGRGRDMFGEPDHDASVLSQDLGGAPAAGFFAAGEIGPVGGQSFLHGFTATVAIFSP